MKMHSLLLSFLAGLFPLQSVMAQAPADSSSHTVPCLLQTDTIPPTTIGNLFDKLQDSKLYRMTYVGVPLVAAGLIVKGEDDHFRSLRNNYLPHFRKHVDDYMQYTPAAVMLGLKAAGVESRSSWGRMLTSDAFSVALMAGVVNTVKRTTQVERPDGSNNHSFPSGHTATAFMTATMLTKEYGDRHPWIGIGAYSLATATGLMRMANNKHWLSDVLTGAGIGILSTEVGYYLADLIFKDKGIHENLYTDKFSRMDKPSFLGLYLGVNVPLSGYDYSENLKFRASSGCTAGLEGAYFFNPFVGVGGRFTASSTYIITNDTHAEDNSFESTTLNVGAYFSYPLSSRWLVGTKLLGGYSYYPRLKLTEVTFPSSHGVCFGSGFTMTYKAKEHYGFRFFLDYNILPAHSDVSREYIHMLVPGASFIISI